MLPPVTAMPAAMPSTASPARPGEGAIQLAGRLDTPTAQDGADFQQAVARSDPASIDAPVPQGQIGLTSHLVGSIDQFSRHLNALQATSSQPSAVREGAASSQHGQMQSAIDQMQHAYEFAIEATMASHGSTESTKIFNTLLKGQ